MRTFVMRARKGTTRWDRIKSQVGAKEHFEVVVHSIMNAFFISNNFRADVTFHVVLDSAEDFPRTITLVGGEGLSIPGFHEEAVTDLIITALKEARHLNKNETQMTSPGVHVSGFGFEKLVNPLLDTNPVYLLDPKGSDVRSTLFEENPVFILSDHLVMPKKNIKSLQRKGLKSISLGNKMLFASQCIVLIHDELDRTM